MDLLLELKETYSYKSAVQSAPFFWAKVGRGREGDPLVKRKDNMFTKGRPREFSFADSLRDKDIGETFVFCLEERHGRWSKSSVVYGPLARRGEEVLGRITTLYPGSPSRTIRLYGTREEKQAIYDKAIEWLAENTEGDVKRLLAVKEKLEELGVEARIQRERGFFELRFRRWLEWDEVWIWGSVNTSSAFGDADGVIEHWRRFKPAQDTLKKLGISCSKS
jgi:hypothetical protein